MGKPNSDIPREAHADGSRRAARWRQNDTRHFPSNLYTNRRCSFLVNSAINCTELALHTPNAARRCEKPCPDAPAFPFPISNASRSRSHQQRREIVESRAASSRGTTGLAFTSWHASAPAHAGHRNRPLMPEPSVPKPRLQAAKRASVADPDPCGSTRAHTHCSY